MTAVLAAVFVARDHVTPTDVKLSSIGASLASAAIVAVVFALSANREQSEVVRGQIEQDFERLASALRKEIATLVGAHIPAAEYPGTASFDSRFNRDLMADLGQSHTYVFRGASAKYVPARLRFANHRFESVRVIMQDPVSTTAGRRRAADRIRNPKYAGLTPEQTLAALREEVSRALVALFDCRHMGSISVAFLSQDPSVTRVELFDTACYLSLYHSADVQQFPSTLRYVPGSTLSEMFRLECARQMEDAEKILTFSYHDGEAELVAKLAAVGLAVDSTILATWRADWLRFYDEFAGQLSNM